MRAARTRVAPSLVRTAERPGSDRPSQDRIFVTKNAVIVLDGASQPEPSDRDGGWYAEVLGSTLRQRLSQEPDADLTKLLAEAIAAIVARYGLQPGNSPSSTVSILRWSEHADVLVLGDSPVVALTSGGRIQRVRDDRLQHVGRVERERLANAAGFSSDHHDRWRRLVDAERAMRNEPGGYWIAEAIPDAAAHAHCVQWDLEDLAAVLVMTDGVSAGVDRYGLLPDWQAAFAVACPDPSRLVDVVHSAEDDDPDGARWRRSKRHDDKAVALVGFTKPRLAAVREPSGG
jgi:Protein phosphatase 2C